MFRGFEKQGAEWMNKKENQLFIKQAAEIHLEVSELEIIDHSYIFAQIHEDHQKAEKESSLQRI